MKLRNSRKAKSLLISIALIFLAAILTRWIGLDIELAKVVIEKVCWAELLYLAGQSSIDGIRAWNDPRPEAAAADGSSQ